MACKELESLNRELAKAIQSHQLVTVMMKECTDVKKKDQLEMERKVWVSKLMEINSQQKVIKNQLKQQDQQKQVKVEPETRVEEEATSPRPSCAKKKKSSAIIRSNKQENRQQEVSHMSLRSESSSSGPTPPKRPSLDTTDEKTSSKTSPGRKKVVFNSSTKAVKPSSLPTQPTAVASDGMYEDLNDADDSVLQPVVVTEDMRKEGFLSGLGLVTNAALKELQNKKSVRKRRSTANPQYSNTTMEAKKANQMAIAANKLQNKELMKTRYSLKVDAGQRRHQRIKDEEQEEEKSIKADKKSKSSHEKTKHKPSKALISSNTVNSVSVKETAIEKACCFCSEDCDTETDAIMFCPACRVLFHMTCASTVEEMASTGVVPCPQCDRKRFIQDQVVDLSSIIYCQEENSPVTPVVVPKKRGRKPKEIKEKELKSSPEMVTLNRENGTSAKVTINSHYDEKRAELIALLEKKAILECEWKDSLESYQTNKKTFLSLRDDHDSLIKNEKEVIKKIDMLVGFIKSAQIWNDIIDADEHHHQSQGLPSLKPVKKSKPIIQVIEPQSAIQPPIVTYQSIKKHQKPLPFNPNGQTLLKVPTIVRSQEVLDDSNNKRQFGVIYVPTANAFANQPILLPKAMVNTSSGTNTALSINNTNGSSGGFVNIAPKPVIPTTTSSPMSLLKSGVTSQGSTPVSSASNEAAQKVLITKAGILLPCEDDVTLLQDNSSDDHTMDKELVMDVE